VQKNADKGLAFGPRPALKRSLISQNSPARARAHHDREATEEYEMKVGFEAGSDRLRTPFVAARIAKRSDE
jgi:hypothetical protein